MATRSLIELAASLPPADPEDLDAVFADVDPNVLAKAGRQVASDRVVTDAARLYGLAAATWAKCTEEQRAGFVGFTPELLSAAVHEACKLEGANETFQRRNDDDRTIREVTAADLGDTWGDGIALKQQASTVLSLVAGTDPVRKTSLERATSGVTDADELARRLDDCAALTTAWLADAKLARVLRLTRVTAAYAAKLTAGAQDVRRAAAAAMARKTVQVTQGDLDLLDGRNLHLLRHLINTFDDAHDNDPAIPRLIPISVATALGRRTRRSAAAAGAGVPDADADADADGVDLTDGDADDAATEGGAPAGG